MSIEQDSIELFHNVQNLELGNVAEFIGLLAAESTE